jgi:pilus assembly protein CpaB
VKRKRIGIVMAVVGALLALGIGTYVYLTAQQAEQLAALTPTNDVVIALVELPERVAVPAAAVAITKVPAAVVPVGAATKLTDVVGKFPLTRVYKNEIVVTDKLADAARSGPAFALKEGMVAVTLPGSDLLTSTGAVRVGDRIDMLLSLPLPKTPPTTTTTGAQQQQGAQAATAAAAATIPIVSQTLMQNLEVMRIGTFPTAGQADAGAGGKSLTFQVSHQDALILKWVKDSGGTVDYVLRHPNDREPVTTEAINALYIFRKFDFKLAEPIQ